jgi:cell wall-associated NlpC family hydrolase
VPPSPGGRAAAKPFGERLAEAARSYLGTPYRYGGTTRRGLDCSGLVVAAAAELGVSLPHGTRQLARLGEAVSKSRLRAGDLLFFATGSDGRVTHVGIYLGRSRFVHASLRFRSVAVDRLDEGYFARRFRFARRLEPPELARRR